MTALRTTAVAGILLLGLGAVADAQPSRADFQADYDAAPPQSAGRSVYVEHAPVSDADADSIVMGLRVPNGLRYR